MKYRKASEIIDQVAEDLSSYDDQGLIDYSKLYKVIRKCNATLGERINPEKQEMIEIKTFKGYMPSDFSSLNYAFKCTKETTTVCNPPAGFQIEYKTCSQCVEKKCSPCVSDCTGTYQIYQLLDDCWTQFTNLQVCRVTPRSAKSCDARCPNQFANSHEEFDIDSNGMITSNFENGTLYINYVGTMEDSDEELLVIDDPNIEPYYENELIKQVLKTVVYNKDADVSQIYGDAKIEASRARTHALNYVSMFGYDEIRKSFQAERKRMYSKYFSPILGDYC